jgi:hypothetical protein
LNFNVVAAKLEAVLSVVQDAITYAMMGFSGYTNTIEVQPVMFLLHLMYIFSVAAAKLEVTQSVTPDVIPMLFQM